MIEEFTEILKEAYRSVEDVFASEDKGWINLSLSSQAGVNVLNDTQRIDAVRKARYYSTIDPMARQAVRLWTDYTFGTGLTWSAKDDRVNEVLGNFWYDRANANIFSPRGQRKSSDKLVIDGEIFFAIFLGSQGQATIRRIDSLEITEIISDPDDLEDVRYYKRSWSDTQGAQHKAYYRSVANIKDEGTKDKGGKNIKATEKAVVYHLAANSTGQRGNSLLLPVLDWIKLYRKFLSSRVAIMLALARFAWKVKVQGGQTAVTAAKSTYNEQAPDAGSVAIENMGADLQPIRTDSNARNAYDDGRQIKLQIASGVGIPEQYFGDISIGNLATAKTVELPMMKMFQSNQAIWAGAYEDINDLILEHNQVAEDKRYVDMDFPPITPPDESAMATNIAAIGMLFPEFLSNRDVMQQALMSIGIHNTNDVLDEILGEGNKESYVIQLTKALRNFKETLQNNGKVPSLQR